MKELNKDKRINKEDKRLRAIYKELPKEVLTLYDGLIKRAAYMRVALEDYEADMDENGYVESFSQSEKTDPYERGRPVVGFYNTMSKNYSAILKQLSEKLPGDDKSAVSDEILKFAMGGKK